MKKDQPNHTAYFTSWDWFKRWVEHLLCCHKWTKEKKLFSHGWETMVYCEKCFALKTGAHRA